MGFLRYIAEGAGWEVGREIAKSAKEELQATGTTETQVPSAEELAARREQLEQQEALRAAIDKKKAEIKKAQQAQRAERELALLKQKLQR
jgi:hypothetical protein